MYFRFFGQVKFNFKKSDQNTKAKIITIEKNYSTIVVPPKIYFSFKSELISLVANTINGVHNEKEIIKVPII